MQNVFDSPIKSSDNPPSVWWCSTCDFIERGPGRPAAPCPRCSAGPELRVGLTPGQALRLLVAP